MSITDTDPTATDAAGTSPGGGAPDPRPLFFRAVALGRDVIAGVRLDQLENSTPCPDFDARTIGHHILGVLRRVVVIGETGTFESVPAFDDVADTKWLDAYDRHTAELQRVWADDALLGTIVTVPWADLPGAIALMIYTNEVLVHTWDLATATGQRPAWDDEAVGMALAAMQRGLPADGREEPVPFGAVIDTADDAPLIDRLVAWNGRTPR